MPSTGMSRSSSISLGTAVRRQRRSEVEVDEVSYVELMAFLPLIEGLRISLISFVKRLQLIRRVLDLSQTNTILRRAAQEPSSVQHAGTTRGAISGQEGRYAGPSLMAGEIHGITLGSQFELCPNRKNVSTSWGRFDVQNVTPTQATLIPINNGTTPVKWHHAVAWPELFPLPEHDKQKVRISEILNEDVAKIALASEDLFLRTEKHNEVVFVDAVDDVDRGKFAVFRMSIPHRELKQLTPDRVTSAGSSDEISDVLHSVGHWNFRFMRAPMSSTGTPDVSIEFYLLKQGETVVDHGAPRHGLVRDGAKPDMNVKNVIEITINPYDRYGMAIVNIIGCDLYPYLSYFDVKSLETCDYLICADGKSVLDPP